MRLLSIFLLFILLGSVFGQINNATLLYEWVEVDYVWESEVQKNYYIDNGEFIVENNIITGVKSWKGEVYVSVPRWRDGVPSTLNKVVTINNRTLLQPYPSWEMQEIGDPSSLQYVQSMEIDSRGWMWILDVGRRNMLADPSSIVNFAPKLIIWDIANNCQIRTFVFPDSVLPWNNSFANDIVVDETNGFAYISNTAGEGGIAVYDFNHNLARLFSDESLNGNVSNYITIHNISYNVPFPSDGIALSHDTKTLYYCDLSRTYLWSVPTYLLQDFSLASLQIAKSVVNLGFKGYSDGMAYTSTGWLFYGNLEECGVDGWNAESGLPLSSASPLAIDYNMMQWVDTFAFDGEGSILFTSNKLQLYVFGGMEFNNSYDANFRIWSVNIGANSYLTGNPVPSSMACVVS